MTTKQLLTLSTVVVFLSGLALGYGINDAVHSKESLTPKNSREQLFAAEIQRERLSTTSKADTLRAEANAAVRNYTYTLSQAARTVTQGNAVTAVQPVIETQVTALGAAYAASMGAQLAQQHQGVWQDLATTVLQYAQSKAANRPEEQALYRQNALSSATSMTQWYTEHIAALNATQLRDKFGRGILDLLASVDVATSGTSASFLKSEQRAADTFAETIDEISVGLVNQIPSKF